jgi:hypothetical protein
MHLSGAAPTTVSIPVAAASGAALRAPAGVILQTMRRIEFLFTDCKDEFLTAITTAQSLLFKGHLTAPPVKIVSIYFRCSLKIPNHELFACDPGPSELSD